MVEHNLVYIATILFFIGVAAYNLGSIILEKIRSSATARARRR